MTRDNHHDVIIRWISRCKFLGRHARIYRPPQWVILLTLTLILVTIVIMIHCKCPHMTQCQYPRLARVVDMKSSKHVPTIYVVTPTYARYVQKAELIRLSQTLLLVAKLHWIIVEDSDKPTRLVSNLVRRLKHNFDFHTITQLHAITPEQFKLKDGLPSWKFPKGIWQRNRALDWLADSKDNLDANGVVYFADDDNTYDLEVFEEMRYTKRVSVWPVGLAGGLLVEKPIVREGKVVSFNSMWRKQRPFPLDMAGFAVSLRALLTPKQSVRFSAANKIGYVESHFLNQLISSWHELEAKASNCSKVLVWHTRTQKPSLHEEIKLTESSLRGFEV